jgi:spermidine dehydrogenase
MPQARILVLENHDDFGGHAKRNEFSFNDQLIIGYGGSEAIQSPKTLWSKIAKDLLHDLKVDVARFDTAFDRKLYASLGLSRAVFFPRETFGHDTLVTGDSSTLSGDNEAHSLSNAKPVAEFVAGFPISEASKAQLLALYDVSRDPEAANCFQGRTLEFYGLGCDSVPAADVREMGYPGFAGLKLSGGTAPEWKEPYIYHFPDGNASLARLLVRSLAPAVAPGHSMEDVILAPFDYRKLDLRGQSVRIRLDSTCVHVRNAGDMVHVAYVRHGALHRVEARPAVLACFNMIIPYIMPELPAPQRAALAQNVKVPLVYTNVLVRNWQPWVRLGVHDISAPMSFHCRVKLDSPVTLGGYHHPRDPVGPILLHLVHVPSTPKQALDARTQFRIGRGKLLTMTFDDFEERICDELDRMLGKGGFSSARDIAAITVNRWSHGYSYVANSLFDRDDYDDVLKEARRTAGRVAIANTDAGGDAWAHYAIDQAYRAVRELVG